jgi:hypothetical protein
MEIALYYLINTAFAIGLLIAVGRLDSGPSRPWLRGSILTLLGLLDACVLFWFDCSIRPAVYLLFLGCIAAITYPAGHIEVLSRALGKFRFVIYALCTVTLAALYYIYLPITTFLTSPGEVAIHLEYLLSTNARNVMVIVYCACALYACAFSSRMRSTITFLMAVSVALALVYSYVYPFGYPQMNGLMFERIAISSGTHVLRAAADVVTVLVVTVVTLLALTRARGKTITMGLVLVNISLGVAAGVGVVGDDSSPEAREQQGSTERQLIQFSPDKPNVLIIFLDRFMGGLVEGILQRRPHLTEQLKGFVWYPRSVAPGENSIAGLHALLGGYDYTVTEMNKRDRSLRDLSVESYAILPHNFTRKGYQANLVSPHGLGFTMAGDCSFLKGIPGLKCGHVPLTVSKQMADQMGVQTAVLSKARYADLLVLLGLMRGTPYSTRAILYERGPWRPYLDHSAGTTFKEWAELKALPQLSKVDSDRSNISVFFNILPHEPYFMGEDCLPRSAELKLSREEVARRGHASLFSLQHEIAAECALQIVADYMTWLQKAGVYDNTKIVIVSDHGIVGDVEDTSSRAKAGGTTDNSFVRSRSVLLVKDRNSSGPLRISEEFMPNAEVPRLVCQEIGGCTNPYLDNKTIEAHGRDQPFIVDLVPWQFSAQEPNRYKIKSQHILTGRDPYDAKAWQKPSAPSSQ